MCMENSSLQRKINRNGLFHWKFFGKKVYLRRFSFFLAFTVITGISLYHLLQRGSTKLLGKIRGLISKTASEENRSI